LTTGAALDSPAALPGALAVSSAPERSLPHAGSVNVSIVSEMIAVRVRLGIGTLLLVEGDAAGHASRARIGSKPRELLIRSRREGDLTHRPRAAGTQLRDSAGIAPASLRGE
jgi:hypothetical protein